MVQPSNFSSSNNEEQRLLIERLRQSSEFAELYDLAQQGDSQLPKAKPSWLARVRSTFIANPKEFYGNALVTEELKQTAQITARVVSASSLIDFLCNQPLWFFVFADQGLLVGVLLGTLANTCLTKITNDCATAAANRKPKGNAVANSALIGLIGMNTIMSLTSGVGAELLLNPTGLRLTRATELIDEQTQRIERLKDLPDSRYDKARHQCEQGKQALLQFDRSTRSGEAQWQSLYAKLYGIWSEREKKWAGEPLETIPVCVRADLLGEEKEQAYLETKKAWEEQLKRAAQSGNDLVFLKHNFPDLYETYFYPDGSLKSGVDAVRIASQTFFGKLQKGQWYSIGLPLFLFSISSLTSTAACAMAISYSMRKDAQMSRSEAITQARDRWLARLQTRR